MAATQDETIRVVLGVLLVTTLVPITLIDLDTRRIPNAITLPSAIAALVAGLALDLDFVPEQLIAGAAAFAFFFAAAYLYPRGMGMGDVKLAGVLGLYLGRAVGPAIFIALITGVLVGVVIIARVGQEAGPQDRGPVRAVSRTGRHDRLLRRRSDRRRLPRSLLGRSAGPRT